MATHSGTFRQAQLHGSVCRPSAPLSRSTITSSQMSHMVERLAWPGRRATPSRPSLKSTLRSSTAFSLCGAFGQVMCCLAKTRRPVRTAVANTRPKCPGRRVREDPCKRRCRTRQRSRARRVGREFEIKWSLVSCVKNAFRGRQSSCVPRFAPGRLVGELRKGRTTFSLASSPSPATVVGGATAQHGWKRRSKRQRQ